MIHGLDHFKARFSQFSNDFILIGGVATHLQLEEIEASKVRPTKDLDIVLFAKPSDEFLKALREYITEGKYEIEKGDDDRSTFYRFKNPQDKDFPVMIELFATAESGFELDEGQRAIPITTPENVESLSALLLDEEYFELIKKNVKSGDGINLLNTFALIPLKAKAYLDIKNRGGDSREWKKHRRDIVNLAVNFVTEETKETLTGNIRIDLEEFLRVVKTELTKDVIKGACEQDISAVEIISSLKKAFL